MPAAHLGRAFFRRWYATLIGLIIAVGLVVAAAGHFPVTYEAKAAIVLVPPVDKAGSNPYLNLGALEDLNIVVVDSLLTGSTLDGLRAAGHGGTYNVVDDPASSAPIVIVTAEDATPAGAIEAVRYIAALVPKELLSLQHAAAVPAAALVTSTMIDSPSKADPVRKSQTRAILAAGAIGALIILLLVAVAENVATRRLRLSRALRDPDELLFDRSALRDGNSRIDVPMTPTRRGGVSRET